MFKEIYDLMPKKTKGLHLAFDFLLLEFPENKIHGNFIENGIFLKLCTFVAVWRIT